MNKSPTGFNITVRVENQDFAHVLISAGTASEAYEEIIPALRRCFFNSLNKMRDGVLPNCVHFERIELIIYPLHRTEYGGFV